jgi:hypothetical protein
MVLLKSGDAASRFPDLASRPEPRRCLIAISCQLERRRRGFLGWRVLTADLSSPISISWPAQRKMRRRVVWSESYEARVVRFRGMSSLCSQLR